MVYAISLNPALDYDIYADNFCPGESNVVDSSNIRASGKAINVAIVLQNLGIDCKLIGFMGGFTGKYISDSLKKRNLVHDFIELEGLTRINIKLISKAYAETEINGPAPNVSEEEINKLIVKLKVVTEKDVVIFSGSLPNGVAPDIYKRLNGFLPSGTKVVLDTRGGFLEKNICSNFLVKPNLGELEEMAGRKLSSDHEIIHSCEKMISCGAKNIIVTRGGDDAMFVSNDCRLKAKVPNGRLVNSVGAGDSTVAGFIAGIMLGRTKADAFRLAVACGSASAYSINLAEQADVLMLYETTKVEEIL